ncbi:MAG: sulfotransferase [Hyphomicrobiales bacterium]|nr:sulfotransferase [Hyphomicrobiales bacterium]MCP5000781.1 sulfotransferase [Hyphomicrobiales bacterium]
MTNTIIHVGLHKTASTYLQKQIFVQSKQRTLLTRPYTQYNKAFNQLLFADDTLYCKNNLQEELKKIGAERLLLSDEAFSGCPIPLHYVNRSLIAHRLADLFPNAEIVLFLRDQRDFCTSHYSSYVKMPYGLNSFEEFMHVPDESYEYEDSKDNRPPASLNSLYYNINDYCQSLDGLLYTRIIALYERLFPKCHVFLFEDMVGQPEETTKRLGAICGEDFEYRPAKENISLSSRDLLKIRRRNLVNRIGGKVFKGTLRALYKFYPDLRTEDIKTMSAQIIGDYFSKDNEVLKAKLEFIDWSRHNGKYV